MSAIAGLRTGVGSAVPQSGRVLYPPANFSMVEKGLYRSSFPAKKNFSFLQHLGIRSILTLVLEGYPEANLKFQQEHGIALLQVGMVSFSPGGLNFDLSTAPSPLHTYSTYTQNKMV